MAKLNKKSSIKSSSSRGGIKGFLNSKLFLIFLLSIGYFLIKSPTALNSIQSFTKDFISNYSPLSPSLSTTSTTTSTTSTTPEEPIIPLDMSPKASVEREISNNKVVVFSKSYCPYCKKAKALLASLGAGASVFELDQMEEGGDWQAYLGDKTGQRTVPSIFIDGNFIGGSSDLEAKNNSGELAKLLKA